MGFKMLLYILSAIAMLTVLLPLIKKDHWIFRIFDYPRLQKFVLIGFCVAIWIGFYDATQHWYDSVIIVALVISFLYLGYYIIPFTPLGKKMIYKSAKRGKQGSLNLLVCNVYQYNTRYDKLLQLISKRNPDIIFLLETDSKWQMAIEKIKKDYPFAIEVPKDNTYGLLFYSRLPLKKHEINYLIDDAIPSIVADVEYDDQIVRIYGVHPAPPVPQEAKYSTNRDAELLLVGKAAKKHAGPCMVIGDLNDVAWSYTTKLFLKSSGLLDPRRGRGMYSTFNAHYFLLRWPLDHFFVSRHFDLIAMNVERNIGSDHFPISICLVLENPQDAEPMHADLADKQLINEKVAAGINGEPL